jgi:hypothetical protein
VSAIYAEADGYRLMIEVSSPLMGAELHLDIKTSQVSIVAALTDARSTIEQFALSVHSATQCIDELTLK